jgi:putative flippase GtrA
MKQLAGQVLRFGLVGLGNTLVAYGVFALLLWSGVHFALATFLGGLAGMLVGFKLTGALVFGNRDSRRIYRFALVFGATYLCNIGVQWLLRPRMDPYLCGAMATLACFGISFGMNRNFVFREAPKGGSKYGSSYAEVQIRRSRNWLRRIVRHVYLSDILRHVRGASIDFGCGAGDLLARLPKGSIGLEINPAAVQFCRDRNLQVLPYDPELDQYELKEIPPGKYTTLLFTHVLEHFPDPQAALKTIFHSCARLGIQRIILTLPCERGFRFDPTHLTYVDRTYLEERGLLAGDTFSTTYLGYFPINQKWLGKHYTFHELRVVLDRPEPAESTPMPPPAHKAGGA